MLTDKFPELKGLILDMDGVLWKDSKPIGDLPYVFKGISDLGLKVVFATNNATKSIEEYQQKNCFVWRSSRTRANHHLRHGGG